MFDFIEYMRQVAIKLKDIGFNPADSKNKRFSRVSGVGLLEEFLQGINYTDGYVLVAQDDFFSRFIDNGSSNIQDNVSNMFYILKRVKKTMDFDEIEQCKKDCLAVMNKVTAKMLRDKLRDHQGKIPKTGMRNLDTGSIFRQKVGPFADGWHGILCGFSMLVSANGDLVYNDDDWNETIVS